MGLRVRGPIIWLSIFVLGGVFQFWRRSQIDTVIYGVVIVLVLLAVQERFRILKFGSTRFANAITILLLATLVFIFSPIHTWQIAVVYLLLALLPLKIAWQRDLGSPQDSDSAMQRSSKIWSVIGLLTCVCELGNYFASDLTHDDKAYPTITVLLDPIVADRWGKVVFMIVWSAIGVGLLRVSTER